MLSEPPLDNLFVGPTSKAPCKHKDFLDSVDLLRRPIRTCSRCGKRLPVPK